uniref:Uncharacterized protein n=1 Tax=Homalodisca liturata TaxID=320908 RepID=A0A1B6IEB7_9HEMI
MEEEEKSATSATALDTLQGNARKSKTGVTDAMELGTLQKTVTRQQMNHLATTAINRATLPVNVQNQALAVVAVEVEAEDLTLLVTTVISLATWPETVLKEEGPVMSAVRLDTYPVNAQKIMTKNSPFILFY